MKTNHVPRGRLTIAAMMLALIGIAAAGCAAVDGDEQNYRELQREPTLFDPEMDPLRTMPDNEHRLAPMRPHPHGEGTLLLLVRGAAACR